MGFNTENLYRKCIKKVIEVGTVSGFLSVCSARKFQIGEFIFVNGKSLFPPFFVVIAFLFFPRSHNCFSSAAPKTCLFRGSTWTSYPWLTWPNPWLRAPFGAEKQLIVILHVGWETLSSFLQCSGTVVPSSKPNVPPPTRILFNLLKSRTSELVIETSTKSIITSLQSLLLTRCSKPVTESSEIKHSTIW